MQRCGLRRFLLMICHVTSIFNSPQILSCPIPFSFRAWSALGFIVTNLIQETTKSSIWMLYLADFVDGCSSCMLPLCQAYIADVSEPHKLAGNLGTFQGLSAVSATMMTSTKRDNKTISH